MSKTGWRERKRQRKAVENAQKQLAIVHDAITALHGALESAGKDLQQVLAVTTRLDALLRRQDRLQRVVERAREPQRGQQENAKPRATAELIAELERRGL
jgi:hypothetical protein